MKLISVGLISCLAFGVMTSGCALKKSSFMSGLKNEKVAVTKRTTGDVLVAADFDSGTFINNLGGQFGAWDKDPNDETQGCKIEFYKPGYDNIGSSLKIAYDVDSPNPAYNGFWMKLESLDLRPYSKFSFWVKGDDRDGYTTKFKIEVKNTKGEVSAYFVNDVDDTWNVVELPLSSFDKITDWSKMTEFVVVFEDSQATQKRGTIYIDDISFIR